VARQLINDANIPSPIFESLKMDFYNADKEQDTFCSVTSVLKSPKLFWGEKRLFEHGTGDLILPASTQVFSQQGHMVHDYFEKSLGNHKDFVVEKRVRCKFMIDGRPIIISGMFDIYNIPIRDLNDYKNMSISKFNRALGLSKFWKDGAKGFPEYEEQTNIYTLMMNLDGKWPVDSIRLIICLRDWSRMEKIKQDTLPDSPYVYHRMPLWNQDVTKKFIGTKIRNILKYENTPTDEIPECTPEERWEREKFFKVYKFSNGKKSKMCCQGTAKLKTLKEAEDWIYNKTKGAGDLLQLSNEELGYTIHIDRTDPLKCSSYCILSHMDKCNYWKDRQLLESI